MTIGEAMINLAEARYELAKLRKERCALRRMYRVAKIELIRSEMGIGIATIGKIETIHEKLEQNYYAIIDAKLSVELAEDDLRWLL